MWVIIESDFFYRHNGYLFQCKRRMLGLIVGVFSDASDIFHQLLVLRLRYLKVIVEAPSSVTTLFLK